MFLSLIFFGFIGGISGVVLGTEQLNVLMHNTLYVPGHFHGTVVAGTTLAFMAATYLVLPLIFQREIIWPKLARIQPYLFGIGVAGISLFMMGAGTLGVSRRHWDMTFSDAVVPYDYPPVASLLMGLNGLSVIVVASILFGNKVDASNAAQALGPTPKRVVRDAVARHGDAGTWDLPGTYA